jgi:hypothetical protein
MSAIALRCSAVIAASGLFLGALGVGSLASAQGFTAPAGWDSIHTISGMMVTNDQEPNPGDEAEMHALAVGVSVENTMLVDAIDLWQINQENVNYVGLGVDIDWDRYRDRKVDIVLIEEDEATDYQALTAAMSTAISPSISTDPDQSYVESVLDALPKISSHHAYVDAWPRFEDREYINSGGKNGSTLSAHIERRKCWQEDKAFTANDSNFVGAFQYCAETAGDNLIKGKYHFTLKSSSNPDAWLDSYNMSAVIRSAQTGSILKKRDCGAQTVEVGETITCEIDWTGIPDGDVLGEGKLYFSPATSHVGSVGIERTFDPTP